jgi:hypothetical protein
MVKFVPGDLVTLSEKGMERWERQQRGSLHGVVVGSRTPSGMECENGYTWVLWSENGGANHFYYSEDELEYYHDLSQPMTDEQFEKYVRRG